MYDQEEFNAWLDKMYWPEFHNCVMDIPEEDFWALEDAYRASLNN